MHSRAAFFVALLFLALAGSPAWGEKRVALVIGNSAYATAGLLKNPTNDAGAIGEMLRRAKFDVVETKRDLSNAEMRRALRDFSVKSRRRRLSRSSTTPATASRWTGQTIS